MKNFKKLTAVFLCLALFAALALGSGSSDSGNTKEAKKDKKETADNSSVTVEEQVLYEGNNVKITATGFGEDIFGPELKLSIENNTDQNIVVQTRDASVNGYMVTTLFSVDVAAGKKANESLIFDSASLEECGIDTVASMEFGFVILNGDSYEEIFNTEICTVGTSAADSYTQEYDDSGEVLVDNNGIRIICKGLSESDSFWGPGVLLYIENNSSQDIVVQARDASVNGYMVDSSMSQDVVVGKKAVTAIQFFDTDLEEKSIDTIESAEFSFHIFNWETFDNILDTEVFSLTF